jgi:hypothetical protein
MIYGMVLKHKENCTFISTSHIIRGTLKKGFQNSTIAP